MSAYTHGLNHLLRPNGHGHGGTCSRSETVGLDVGFGSLDGERSGQSRDGSFGGRVVGLPDGTVCRCQLVDWIKQCNLTDTIGRTGGDDSTILLFLEVRPASLDTLQC